MAFADGSDAKYTIIGFVGIQFFYWIFLIFGRPFKSFLINAQYIIVEFVIFVAMIFYFLAFFRIDNESKLSYTESMIKSIMSSQIIILIFSIFVLLQSIIEFFRKKQ